MDDLLSLISPEPWGPFTAALIVAMAFSRGMDFLSTWIVTPKLELEANPLMRRVGFIWMALLNLPLLGLPLLHHGLSITFIVTSLLAAGSNLANGALARGMGEKRQAESQARAIREIGLSGALAMNSAGAVVICLGGVFLMFLSRGMDSYPWWGGLGVVMYGVVGLFHFNLSILRLGRKGGKGV